MNKLTLVLLMVILLNSCITTRDNIDGIYFLKKRMCLSEIYTSDNKYYMYNLMNEASADSAYAIDGYTHWQLGSSNIDSIYSNDTLVIVGMEKTNKYHIYSYDFQKNKVMYAKAKNLLVLNKYLNDNGYRYPITFTPVVIVWMNKKKQ